MKIFFGLFKRKKKVSNSKNRDFSVSNWPDHIITLEGKNFSEFIQKYPFVIVDFWASWCAPCRAMEPRLRRLSKIYKGKVAFGKLDIKQNQNIAKQYKIIGIPHLIFFKFGKKVTSITGIKSVGAIKDVIDNYLQKGGRLR